MGLRCISMVRVPHSQDSAEKDASAHDLSRKGKFDQLDPGTSSVSSENDAAEELCSNCQRIDFEGAFHNSAILRSNCGVVIAELGRKGLEWGKAACAMCRLFAAVHVQPADRPTTDSLEYHLRALPFLRTPGNMAFDKSLPEHLDKPDSHCFLVLSNEEIRQKSGEPWQQSEAWLIDHSLSFGAICPVVSSATEPPPHVGTRQLLPDRIDYHLLRYWYGFCAQNHRKTCASHSKEYPEMLKVIDCRTRRVTRAPPICSYVALNYVWGKQQSTTVSSKTIPNVISDAMIVTLELGWKYLWVDRYCIDQNDEEKHMQISQMDKVYSCAVLTIVAAAGESANYGLPGISNTLRRTQPCAVVRGQLLAFTMRSPRVAIGSSRWATRGWTYQEAALSIRRLVFTEDQVFFECKCMSCSESHSVPPALLDKRCGTSLRRGFFDFLETYDQGEVPQLSKIDKYWREVSRFTARELSYETDSLNAFMGVANYYKNGQGSQSEPLYTHIGLPLDSDICSSAEQPSSYGPDFVVSLLWDHSLQHVSPKRRRGFPSYSWIGWEGVTYGPPFPYSLDNSLNIKPMARILRHPGTDPELSTPLGTTLDVEAATLQGQIEVSDKPALRGLAAHVSFNNKPDSKGRYTTFCLTNWKHHRSDPIMLPRDFLSRHQLCAGQIFFVDCVFMGYSINYEGTYELNLMLIEFHGAIAERIGAIEYHLSAEQFQTLPKTRRRICLG